MDRIGNAEYDGYNGRIQANKAAGKLIVDHPIDAATIVAGTSVDETGIGEVLQKDGIEELIEDELSSAQLRSFKRFNKKLPKNAHNIKIRRLPNGSKAFQADSPAANIPNSFARYEKQIDKNGKILQYTKTTINGKGNIVHIATKYPENFKLINGVKHG